MFVQFNLLTANPHKMMKHIQTIRRQELTNYLSEFDHFVELVLKGLKIFIKQAQHPIHLI